VLGEAATPGGWPGGWHRAARYWLLILNWLTRVKDEFGEKPKYAAPLGALGAAAMTVGVGIFVVGVLQAL
jgi:hypothetical protein